MAASTMDTNQDVTTECNELKKLMDQPLKEGDTWYLISARWFTLWKKYVGFDSLDQSYVGDQSCHPGNIDNSSLLKDSSNELKEHLTEDFDYILLPEPAWDMLVQKYTLVPGQSPIARKVVDHGMQSTYLKIEIYLTELKLAKYPDVDKCHSKKFSKKDTLETVEATFREIFDIPKTSGIHLWSKSSTEYEALSQKKQTIQEFSLVNNQVIVAEVQNQDGSWPKKAATSYKRSTVAGTSYSSRYDSDSSSSRTAQPGVCGLNNLGNTCFMNSVLQCMSNIPPIQRYFLEGHHNDELNTVNPLGNHGEIAVAFADLLKAMWSGNHHSYAPRDFKSRIGKFAPQFYGYQQHDSQELLTFLLDGLHEDLNRILKKPYIIQKDADGRSDEEVAQEAWENYRKRNDSVIVDLFHGLLKSTLICPECEKVSVTFDPTCYLSLPLPVKKERSIEVFLVRLDPEVNPVKYRVIVSKTGNIQELTEALSKLSGVEADHMVVTDVYQHRFHQTFSNENSLSQITERDTIYVYELPEKVGTPGTSSVNVYFKEARTKNNYGCGNMFGVPMILQLPREGMDHEQIYNRIYSRLKRCLKTIEADSVLEIKSSVPCEELANSDNEMEVDPTDDSTDIDNGNDNSPQTNGLDSVAGTKHLFTMDFVNTGCNSILNKLKRDEKPITLPAKCYIACEWDPEVKKAYFDGATAEHFDEDASVIQKTVLKKPVLQLSECLELFTSVERLGADDAWYCPNCKKHQRATKKFDLWSLPEVLVIHLKRFSFTRSLRDKLDTLVDFPTRDLDMHSYIIGEKKEEAVYDLIGVCNHYGGLGGGHYTAYARNKDDNRWYYFDDSSVSESSESAVCTKAAYVLFYLRKNSSNSWLNNVRQSPSKSSPIPVHRSPNIVDSEEEMESS